MHLQGNRCPYPFYMKGRSRVLSPPSISIVPRNGKWSMFSTQTWLGRPNPSQTGQLPPFPTFCSFFVFQNLRVWVLLDIGQSAHVICPNVCLIQFWAILTRPRFLYPIVPSSPIIFRNPSWYPEHLSSICDSCRQSCAIHLSSSVATCWCHLMPSGKPLSLDSGPHLLLLFVRGPFCHMTLSFLAPQGRRISAYY